jgi:hypothetical protein
MATPRIKRPFAGAASDPAQRQITSFFNRADGSGLLSPSGPQTDGAEEQLDPASLPAHVQANLLSVGMRVRKSVPEGYKTGSAAGAFHLWSEKANKDRLFNSTAAAGDKDGRARLAPPEPRELLPFCGLHKVGGMATQPGTTSYAPLFAAADFAVPSADEVPSLTSSQESAASEASATTPARPGAPAAPRLMTALPRPAPTRKRVFYADEDYGIDTPTTYRAGPEGAFDPRDWLDGEISPRSVAPVGWGSSSSSSNSSNNAQRPIAVPRRRSGRGTKGIAAVLEENDFDGGAYDNLLLQGHGPEHKAAAELATMGKENVMAVDRDDFEEAGFLDFRSAMERGEVRDMAMDG